MELGNIAGIGTFCIVNEDGTSRDNERGEFKIGTFCIVNEDIDDVKKYLMNI